MGEGGGPCGGAHTHQVQVHLVPVLPEHVVEQRDAHVRPVGAVGRAPAARVALAQLLPRALRHVAGALHGAAQLLVVQDDGHAVRGQLHVELHVREAGRQRRADRLVRALWGSPARRMFEAGLAWRVLLSVW